MDTERAMYSPLNPSNTRSFLSSLSGMLSSPSSQPVSAARATGAERRMTTGFVSRASTYEMMSSRFKMRMYRQMQTRYQCSRQQAKS